MLDVFSLTEINRPINILELKCIYDDIVFDFFNSTKKLTFFISKI